MIAKRYNSLPVALHVPLLEVRSEAMHVLVVGEDGVRLGSVEVVVPDPDECQDYGNLENQTDTI